MVLTVALACTSAVRRAQGYCTAHSCDPDAVGGEECELNPDTQCSEEGVALRRPSGCIDIAVQEGTTASIPGLSDRELEEIILEAFAQWTGLNCGSGPPSIQIQSAGVVQASDAFACEAVPEQNIDLWMLSDELTSSQVVTPTTGTVAGVTYPSFFLDTGEVFDADVKLNTLWALVQDEDQLRDHLRTVAAHEAGHALGLAHSQHEEALMFRNYSVTADRLPTADDRQGICQLYPPGGLDCDTPELTSAALNQNACNEAYLEGSSQGIEPEQPQEVAAGCALRSVSRTMGQTGLALFVIALALAIAFRRALRNP